MKKIGLLNFHYSNNNYGAVLQAAALAAAVNELGFDCEHINFTPNVNDTNSIRVKIGNLLRLLKLRKPLPILPKINNTEVFEQFRNDYILRSEQISERCNLNKIANNYTDVIVGSDQVWRPPMTKDNVLVYFLDFLNNETNKISYAASFGIDYWAHINDKKLTKNINILLNKFNYISCREDSGVKICNDVFNVNAEHVLDPTLLIGSEFFIKMLNEKKTSEKEYDIIYYKLDVDDVFKNKINVFKDKLGFCATDIYYYENNGEFYFESVYEWLNKIRESKIVITDSFHCVCFSILFKKEFIFYPNESRGLSRLESLLSSLGLSDRICYDRKLEPFLNKNKIDYNEVHSRLSILRKKSYSFLEKSLNDA